MEPIVVAGISAFSAIISGLVVSIVKPVSENWLDKQKERRALRRRSLDRLSDAVAGAPGFTDRSIRVDAATIGDPALNEHVGRWLVGSEQERADSMGDVAQRVGELRAKIY